MAVLIGIIDIVLAILVIAGAVSGTFFAWFFLIGLVVAIIIESL